ncbi:Wzz/FepE/Etk N-terminal domain-containing protein [Phocaeicola sp.]
MTEDRNNNNKALPQGGEELEIDLMEYVRKLWSSRKFLLKAAGIGAVIGLVIAFSLPKQYTVEVTLSPESGKSGGGGLSGMASMLGLGNMSMGSDADALNISLFPDIVASTPFILELFDVHVQTLDGKIDTTLVAYLGEQKGPWWSTVMALPGMAIGGVMSLFTSDDEVGEAKLDPFHLTNEQAGNVASLRGAITADVDKKSGMTNVSVTLQDPMVAATVTDTVVAKLQQYITTYRVSKAQQDCDYLEQLYKERQQDYYDAQQSYARYMDANKGVILQSALTERERLQNEMSLAYQVYSQVATQLQVARAKVQEAKPVFAVVEPASVPLQPSGTGKKMILIGFVFLALVGSSAWVLFGRDLVASLKEGLNATAEEKK